MGPPLPDMRQPAPRDTFLSQHELEQLTGYAYAKRQIVWLKGHGWVFIVNTRGRPIVSRAHAEEKLGSLSKVRSRTQPNLEHVT